MKILNLYAGIGGNRKLWRGHQIKDLEELYGYDLSSYRLRNKRQVLRNCVSPELGKYIIDSINND